MSSGVHVGGVDQYVFVCVWKGLVCACVVRVQVSKVSSLLQRVGPGDQVFPFLSPI